MSFHTIRQVAWPVAVSALAHAAPIVQIARIGVRVLPKTAEAATRRPLAKGQVESSGRGFTEVRHGSRTITASPADLRELCPACVDLEPEVEAQLAISGAGISSSSWPMAKRNS